MSVVENLIKSYGDFDIEIPRWEIADNGVTALIGPSGSGKTSVFRLMTGVESCDSFRWTFKGEDLSKLTLGQKNLGVVFQTLELFPHMSARENILFAARARGKSEEGLDELVRDLQLDSCLDRKAAFLSGGEAQRVALARAVIAGPRFLFLDEPFSALDNDLRGEARQMVRRLIDRLQIPTLLITHDQEDIAVLADHTVCIQRGRLVEK